MSVEEEPLSCPAETDSTWALDYPELMPGMVYMHPCEEIRDSTAGLLDNAILKAVTFFYTNRHC